MPALIAVTYPLTKMTVAITQRAHHSQPSASKDWFPKRPKPQAMKTAVNPESILIARFLCVAFWKMILGLIDIATKINPASAAAPPPTMTKKLLHRSSIENLVLPKRRHHARASSHVACSNLLGVLSH